MINWQDRRLTVMRRDSGKNWKPKTPSFVLDINVFCPPGRQPEYTWNVSVHSGVTHARQGTCLRLNAP
jgi:hypothetical protein